MRRIHLTLSDETGLRLDKWVHDANDGFDEGRVTHSDCAEFVLSQAQINIEQLRRRKTDLSRLLIKVAREDTIDVDALISQLRSLRETTPKTNRKAEGEKK